MSLSEYASLLEGRMARRIITDALAMGYSISIDDGGAIPVKESTDAVAIADALATTSDDFLMFYFDGRQVGWVRLVWGNESDLISDHANNERTRTILQGAEQLATAADDPDPASLLDAAKAARAYLISFRDELLESYCLKDDAGQPDRSTLEGDEVDQVAEVDQLLANLDAAIGVSANQPK